jgi:hypothetical protein
MDSRKQEFIKLVDQYAESYIDDNKLTGDLKLQEEIKKRYDTFPEGHDKKYIKTYISSKAAGYDSLSEEKTDVDLNLIRGSYLAPLADTALITGKLTLTRSILCCFFGAACGFAYTHAKKAYQIATNSELARRVKPYQDLMKALRLEIFSLPEKRDRQDFSREENAPDGMRQRRRL